MSHCYGVRCRTHQRIMESAACPEKGCPGHGFEDVDCDERCPDYRIQQFDDLLAQSSFGAEGDVAIRDEDRPGPGDHAWLDRFLAEDRGVPIDDYLDGLRFDKKFLGDNGISPK